MFNLLKRTLTTDLDSASKAAEKLIEAVTPETSVSLIEASELLGLGITMEISSKADAMTMAELEAEDTPNEEEGVI